MRIGKKKAPKVYVEIDKADLKKLKVFESVDGNYNTLGFTPTYTRIPGGVVRTIINSECADQLFIPLPAEYFS